MANRRRRCKHIKTDGKRCKARPLTGSLYCFFHDPDKAIERRAAQKRGHANSVAPRAKLSADLKTLSPGTPNVKIKSANDVTRLLALTVNQVRRGEIGVRVATAVGYLSSYILKSREQGELEERLATIEEFMEKERGNR